MNPAHITNRTSSERQLTHGHTLVRQSASIVRVEVLETESVQMMLKDLFGERTLEVLNKRIQKLKKDPSRKDPILGDLLKVIEEKERLKRRSQASLNPHLPRQRVEELSIDENTFEEAAIPRQDTSSRQGSFLKRFVEDGWKRERALKLRVLKTNWGAFDQREKGLTLRTDLPANYREEIQSLLERFEKTGDGHAYRKLCNLKAIDQLGGTPIHELEQYLVEKEIFEKNDDVLRLWLAFKANYSLNSYDRLISTLLSLSPRQAN